MANVLSHGHALREIAAMEAGEMRRLGIFTDEDGVYVSHYTPCFFTWEEWDELVCKTESARMVLHRKEETCSP